MAYVVVRQNHALLQGRGTSADSMTRSALELGTRMFALNKP
jgi:hypothetical protein